MIGMLSNTKELMLKINTSRLAIKWFLRAYCGMGAGDTDWLSPDVSKAYKELTDNFLTGQESTIGNTGPVVIYYSLAEY